MASVVVLYSPSELNVTVKPLLMVTRGENVLALYNNYLNYLSIVLNKLLWMSYS